MNRQNDWMQLAGGPPPGGYGPPPGGAQSPPPGGYGMPLGGGPWQGGVAQPPGMTSRAPSAPAKPKAWPYLLAVLFGLATLGLGLGAFVEGYDGTRWDEDCDGKKAALKAALKTGDKSKISSETAGLEACNAIRIEHWDNCKLYGSLGGGSFVGCVVLIVLGASINKRR